MPSGTSYGFGVDYYAMYELGNAWIRLGDELDERTRMMTQAVSGMDWTGSAAGSMRTVWGEGGGDASGAGVTSLLIAARDNAYQIGGVIHHYAATVLAAEERAEKLALASFLGGMFGSLLTLAFPLIASIGFFGRAFIILDQAVGRMASVITRMVPNALLGPGAKAVAERGLGYLGGAVTGAASNTAVDFAIQAIAHRAVGENYKPTAVDAAFSAGFGAVFGAAGFVHFREANLGGPNAGRPHVAAPPPPSGPAVLPRNNSASSAVTSGRAGGLPNVSTIRPAELHLQQNLPLDVRPNQGPTPRDGAVPALRPNIGQTGGPRNDAGGQEGSRTPVSATPDRPEAVGGEFAGTPQRADTIGGDAAPIPVRVDAVGGEFAGTPRRPDTIGGDAAPIPVRVDAVGGEFAGTPQRADTIGGDATPTPVRADGDDGSGPVGGTRPTPPVGRGPVVDGATPRTLLEPAPAGHDPLAHAGGPEGFAARQEQWHAFRDERDAVYLSRLDLEERYNWATTFGPDNDLATAQASFRVRDPEGAKLIESDPTALRDLNTSYHRDLRQGFENSWRRTSGHPEADQGWSNELSRLRGGLRDRFEHFVDRQRLIDDFDGAFTRSLEQFQKDDLFGGAYLADPPESAHTIRYDEATGMNVAYRDVGPAGQLRAAGRAAVAAAADSAWQSAGNQRPQGEHARSLDNTISELRAGLPGRLAHRSDQERQVWHAERAFDRAYDDWQGDVRQGAQLSDEAADRARLEFLRDMRQQHDQLQDLPPERFGPAWERTDEGVVGTIPERLEHSGFRERALERGQRSMDQALAQHQERSPLEVVSDDSKERLTAAWLRDVETAVDDHWFNFRDEDAGLPGPGETHDTGFGLDPRLTWDDRFERLTDTLPHRITHELEKNIVLGQAARDFHHLAGHPDDLRGQRYDVSTKQFDDIAKEFRGDTITWYDRIWGPNETDSRAWLEHEATQSDLFTATLTAAQEAPLPAPARPTPRPDAEADGPAAPSAEAKPTPVGTVGEQPVSSTQDSNVGRSTSLGEQPIIETARSARTADERAAAGFGSEQVQVQAQAVHEPVSQTAQEPVSETVSAATSRANNGSLDQAVSASPQPFRPVHEAPSAQASGPQTYRAEFAAVLRAEAWYTPAYTNGGEPQRLQAERLDSLRNHYVQARVEADVNGPADASEVDDLGRSVTDAARRLWDESTLMAGAVREFRERHDDPGRNITENIHAHTWYIRQVAEVSREFSTALVTQGLPARARLEHHFGAHVEALRTIAPTLPAELRGVESSNWRAAAWQARREQLDAAYVEALVQAAQEHQTPVSRSEESSNAESSTSTTTAEGLPQVVAPAVLDSLRTRFNEDLDRASASITALILNATDRPGAADQQAALAASVLSVFGVEDTDAAASAASALRERFGRELLIMATQDPAPAEHTGTSTSDSWDSWYNRQVERLPMRLVVEAAREATISQARGLGSSIGRAWESALPVSSPTFVKAFDVMDSPVPADLRQAIVERYVADVDSQFAASFAVLTSAVATTKVLDSRLEDWRGFSRTASDRLDMSFPVTLAARQATSTAERVFEEQLVDLDPEQALSEHQQDRLRQEFVTRVQQSFTDAFAGHTGEASDLTARTWQWQEALSGHTEALPEHVAFETIAGGSLREAGLSFQQLSRGHDIDVDRLETLAVEYRREWFHELRTLWAPSTLSKTWLQYEEQTDDAFTRGLTDHLDLESSRSDHDPSVAELLTTGDGLDGMADWRKSSRSIPAEEGGPIYCVEVAYLQHSLGSTSPIHVYEGQ
ncbi:hypothetical protein ACIGB8_24035 [Promicromonospora sukumoe]|uniref:hypothetical protein n=1 Tax=Promicromonospora sukumoe TaxID=88382 RepID=UPI0037C82513